MCDAASQAAQPYSSYSEYGRLSEFYGSIELCRTEFGEFGEFGLTHSVRLTRPRVDGRHYW